MIKDEPGYRRHFLPYWTDLAGQLCRGRRSLRPMNWPRPRWKTEPRKGHRPLKK